MKKNINGIKYKNKVASKIAAVLSLSLLLTSGVVIDNPIYAHAESITAVIADAPAKDVYEPTQIKNGDFKDPPGMSFKIGSTNYGTGYYTNISNNTKVSSINPNGVGAGWNTTEQKIYKGSLFEVVIPNSQTMGTFCKWSEYSNKFTTPYGICVEMNSYVSGTLYQDLKTTGGDVIRWTLDHTARTPGGDTTQSMLVEVGKPKYSGSSILPPEYDEDGKTKNNRIEPATSAVYKSNGVTNGSLNCGYYKKGELDKLSVTQTESTKWYNCAGIYVIPEGQTVTRFAFQSLSNTPTAGNMLDNITFSTLIGNLAAKSYTNGVVKISGYWGETDTSKQLMVDFGEGPFGINMNGVTGNFFEVEIPAVDVGIAKEVSVYHQDYPQAARNVEILRYVNYGSDNLNNIILEDEDRESVQTAQRVVKAETKADLTIYVNDESDDLSLYKIGDVAYAERELDGAIIDSYSVNWIDEVKEWVAKDANSAKYSSAIYGSPMTMATATSESQRAKFYKDLLRNDGNISESLTAVELGDEYPKYASNDVAKTRTYENLPYGIYAVLAKDDDNVNYAPLVVSVVPYQNGPSGSYYINYVYYASLKDASATIDKYINGNDSTTVAYGDTVHFDIELTIPLAKARVTINEDGTPNDQQYKMSLTDIMSKAFIMKDTNGDKIIDASDISITYKELEGSEATPLNPDVVDYYEIAAAGYTGEGTVLGNEDSQKTYTYESTKIISELKDCKAVVKNGPIYTVDKVVSSYGNPSEIEINFNVLALKAWLKQEGTPNSLAKVIVSYDAIVTDAAEVGSDINENRAVLTTDADDPISSKVKAYTYALKLVKIDGETFDDEDPVKLPGAEFAIYKESDVYLKDAEGHYTWLGDVEGSEACQRISVASEDEESEPVVLTPADFLGDKNYYIYEDEEIAFSEEKTSYVTSALVKDENGELKNRVLTKEANSAYEGYTIVHLYEKYKVAVEDKDTVLRYSFDGEFETYNLDNAPTEAEIGTYTVNGLKEGNYIVIETKSPAGYNDLAEDIVFAIDKLDKDMASTYTYKAFRQMDGSINESGVLDLTVLNYKGLTLPSTGGRGTILYVFMGICLMLVAVILLVVKRKE